MTGRNRPWVLIVLLVGFAAAASRAFSVEKRDVEEAAPAAERQKRCKHFPPFARSLVRVSGRDAATFAARLQNALSSVLSLKATRGHFYSLELYAYADMEPALVE